MKKFFLSGFILFTILKVSADPCTASFSYSVNGFIINLNASASTGDITHWEWYYNGNVFSDTGPETHYIVNEAGTYEICLIITTASACSDTVCETVVVEPQQDDCEACFSYSVDGQTIYLDGSCSTGDVTNWQWYINGDLFSDAGPETHHSVDNYGEYEICLIIITASGCTDTICHGVNVESQQGDCVSCFTYEVDGFTIHLNGSCSEGDVTHWSWYFNGDLFSDAGPENHYTVTEAGTYVICLIITTASGCIDTVCQEIHVEAQDNCESCFTYVVDGFTIHLNGSCSEGDVTHWAWYFNGDLFSDAGPENHYTVTEAGTYVICLIITTASGCIDTVCQEIHVEAQDNCESCFTYEVDGFTIHLNGSCSYGDVTHWAWYFNGDLFSDAGPENHYTVTEAGTYVICLIITTASGCIDTVCQEIHVEAQDNCESCFTYEVDGFTIHLNGSCSYGDVTHWAWYFNGDLFSDAGPENHYTVTEAGTYVICLIITTASGCIDTVCKEIHVEAQQGDCESCFTYEVDGFTIHLNGSCSEGDVTHWAWYFNGDLFSDAGPENHYTVTEAGTYVICLIITTASGCIDTVCQEIHVEAQDNCESCFTYEVDGFTIHLNGSCSYGDVTHWAWYFNGDLFSDAGPENHYTVTEAGTYVICLIITTASGCIDTVCKEIHVEEQQGDCEACFTYWSDGLTIHLNGSCSAGDVAHWQWYINDDLFSDAGPETHITVDHSGEYEICLIITTASGCIDTICHNVNVEEQDGDCEACFTYWNDGLTIHFNGSCSVGDVAHWQWYINDDLFSDAGPETHTTVDHSGEYEICLIIETADGCVDTVCEHIIIEGLQGGDYFFKASSSTSEGNIIIQLSSPKDGSFTLLFFDMSGKVILEKTSDLNAGLSQYTLLAKQIVPGCYLMTVNFNNEVRQTNKVLIWK